MFRESSYKRKRGNGARGGQHGNKNWNNSQHQNQKPKHWDEPGDSTSLKQSESAAHPVKKPKRYQIDHSLTQEELWDDSALIAAWDAAAEEYESLNGPEKKWKEDPINKSALWYAPPAKPQEEENDEDDEEEEEGEEVENVEETEHAIVPDSAPIDFNTFVPSHDPTLGVAQTPGTGLQPPTNTYDFTKLTKDEIFEKAVSASYWAGYWAAMYHARNAAPENEADAEEEEEADEMVYVVDRTDTPQNAES
ncbi:hypothetical protein RSOLAG22IIIB_01189 [Rhizoctonia solani]|uniref:Survival Motor Neuron Gemin2-binding domain-containing protein n=1 Tax=Rhizoctonia solani TaxID=456999 RepID=A0A0K6G5D0_9AGAM|nr:hypothetical protein RSOLAG22IIIB_01189 [Rhizoctonia solani]